MPEVAQLRVAPRFRRSVQIKRDFHDLRHRLDGYQVTPLVLQTAARIIAGLEAEASERAFSLVGPFGAGKSAFGLFVAHLLQRTSAARQSLLASLQVEEPTTQFALAAPSLLAVLVPGNHSSLRAALLQALHEALRDPALRSYSKGGIVLTPRRKGAKAQSLR